jgi:DNA-binding HxlR family transcriptional regulator
VQIIQCPYWRTAALPSLPVVPPHAQYRPTAMGKEVSLRMDGLTTWIEENLPRILAAREGKAPALE